MLVLSRKQTESIVIGENITIKVMRINGGRVRIAIDAPEHVRVSRGELLETTLAHAGENREDHGTKEFHQVT